MGSPTIDLVGPGGWEHGFIAVRPPATNRPGAKIGKARTGPGRGTTTPSSLQQAYRRLGGKSPSGSGYGGPAEAAARKRALIASARDLRNRISDQPYPTPEQMRGVKPPQPIGPSMGTLGKAARGNRSLPTGKSALTSGGRAAAFQAGHALPPPSKGSPHGYPITDAKSWENARQAVGRVKSPARRAALAALLRRTAGQYGKTKALKASWAASNTGPALEFAVAAIPVTGPLDLLISRDPEDGSAIVRHRLGGGEIGRIRHSDDGQWRAAREGKDLSPHVRQRGALLELIGVHNHAAPSPYRRQPAPAAEPLQPRPQQTDLMRAYGIPAVNLAAATPVVGASDGPKITNGLGTRGQTIYKKLRGRGFPHARAHSFARRAERKAKG